MSRWRIGFALAGFAAALLSIAYDDRRIAWVAILLLVISLILRLLVSKREKQSSDDSSPV
jgi:preprotein translocase subunit SecG